MKLYEIIGGIQDNYLDYYECYLIRKLYDDNIYPREKENIKEHLNEYYKFIGCFGLTPYINNKTNDNILKSIEFNINNNFNDYTISDTYMKFFHKICDNTTISESNRIRKDVFEIIRRNSKQNLEELNKKVAALFNMDEVFKNQLIETCNSQS